jgi:hypothetical protein
VVINYESNIGAILLIALLHFTLLLSFAYHLFPALPEYQYKCTQPCYVPPATQKEKVDWNSSTRNSTLCAAPVVVLVELWSLLLFHSILHESRLSL